MRFLGGPRDEVARARNGWHGHGGSSDSPLGADIADVRYPLYLGNGRAASAPHVYLAGTGETVRLRLINAGSATPFRSHSAVAG